MVVFTVVVLRLYRRYAVRRICRHAETEVVGLRIRVGITKFAGDVFHQIRIKFTVFIIRICIRQFKRRTDAGSGFTILRRRFTPDNIGNTRRRQQIAFVTAVDEDLAADTVAILKRDGFNPAAIFGYRTFALFEPARTKKCNAIFFIDHI